MIYTLGDLAGLPVGTRIKIADGRRFTLVDECGGHYWVWDPKIPGVLYSALVSWLPVEVLQE